MAVILADIQSVTFHDAHFGPRGHACIRFIVANYDASADTGLLGTGGKLFGVTSSLNLEDQLESIRKDGKTLNIVGCMPGGAGRDGSVTYYADTTTVSTNDVAFEISDIAGTEIDGQGTDGATGVKAIPMEILVAYDLS